MEDTSTVVTILNELKWIIGAFGGWAVLTIALSTWIGQRIAERINIKWKDEQNKRFEVLKAEITHSQTILNAAVASFSSECQATQQKRLISVENLWVEILNLKKICGRVILFYDILQVNEYNMPKSYEILGDLKEDFMNTETLEINRPFVSSDLWNLFFIYRQIIGRSYWLTMEGRNNKDIQSWKNDKAILQARDFILTKEENEYINTSLHLDNYAPISFILNIVEMKILNTINCEILGKTSIEASLQNALELTSLMKNFNQK